MTQILIVDDHPLMCDALALTLKISFGLKNVRTARSLAAAQEQIRAQRVPDAVILDLNVPDARGAEGLVTLAGSRLYTSAAYTEEMIDDVLARFDRVLAACGPMGS